jgi:DNA replicative helicase MCM subunit Mcm2 (Cdc46/Mcm family)
VDTLNFLGYNTFEIIFLFIVWRIKMEDRTLICQDCGSEFTFTVGEQEFYKEKGFDNEPKRCKECRDKKKTERRQFQG